MGDIPTMPIPYRYQEEVFHRAQQENIIAALNTGSGKTLISIILIKWIASQDKARGKAIIFLVPKVALVEQQRDRIKKHTSLRVAGLHGSMGGDLTNRLSWKQKFNRNDVFVMTAQIFLNLITHGVWSLKNISLIILDECHHARKNHPYSGIMREYMHIAPSEKPKIFGMTASPIWNDRNPEASIAELERNMNSKVIGVRENVEELEEKSPKPEERVERYPYPPETYECSFSTLFQCLVLIDKSVWDSLGIPFQPTLEIRFNIMLSNLGPYCAAMFLYLEVQHLIQIAFDAKRLPSLPFDPTFDEEMDEGFTHTVAPEVEHDGVHHILDILEGFSLFFPSNALSHEVPIPVSLDWCTPKVKLLVDILLTFEAKSQNFQCIIFVAQRHIASALSKVLPAIPELQGKVKSAFLVGSGVNSDGVSRTSERYPGDSVKLFRDGDVNVLITTSAGEEGLDFKECDLVIRFDDLHHMIAYVQSRGRARKKESTFILMLPEGNEGDAQLAKYRKMQGNEANVTEVYRTRHIGTNAHEQNGDDESDEEYSPDLVDRERYVVSSTGAVLTYDNSLHLLGWLCSLIPRDAFTPTHKPKYTGDYVSTLHLPPALPLDPENRVYIGPPKLSKKEAKRAVAFKAVVRLRELNVFNEYLLPKASENEDEDGTALTLNKIVEIPDIMTTSVRDPWCIGHQLWLHPVVVNGEVLAGLVTGTSLPIVEIEPTGCRIRILQGQLLEFDQDKEHHQRQAMEEFTKQAIQYNTTARPFTCRLSMYLIPVTPDCLPDFEAINRLLANPRGCNDWSQVGEGDYDKLLVMSRYRFGSMHLLHSIRHDLTPMSTPPPFSKESHCATYHEYWVKKWSSKKWAAIVDIEGPLLETRRVCRSQLGHYPLEASYGESKAVLLPPEERLLPQGSCVWVPISNEVCQVYEVMPSLCRRITDVYRAQCARRDLQLSGIPDDLLIEAFTIPSSALPFNNQRFETLGDAVLQLCTTVHLLNLYPNQHEGQLSILRQKIVSNRYLFQRAMDLGLEQFINCEISSVSKWRYVHPDEDCLPVRYAVREYAKKSLPDCMEALLGASFFTGGIPLALKNGTSLGLEFGGPLPWFMRYPRRAEAEDLPPLFRGLEERLGYTFRHPHLVREALTHPSAASPLEDDSCPSYQRLEFLGDGMSLFSSSCSYILSADFTSAILDLVVVNYLYHKFPGANSHQLSFPRTKVICAATLAYLAVTRLGLHKMFLFDSFDLNRAISQHVPVLESLTAGDIVMRGWKYEPPKALSDIFESIIGAVLVDSGYDYEKVAVVVEHVMADVLEVVSPDLAKDPVSELTEWAAGLGCRALSLKARSAGTPEWPEEGCVVLVHDAVITGPVVLEKMALSRFEAADRAMTILKNEDSDQYLKRLCTCDSEMQVDHPTIDSPSPDVEDDAIVAHMHIEDSNADAWWTAG